MSPHRKYRVLSRLVCRRCLRPLVRVLAPSGKVLDIDACDEVDGAAPDGHWMPGEEMTRGEACKTVLLHPHGCGGER